MEGGEGRRGDVVAWEQPEEAGDEAPERGNGRRCPVAKCGTEEGLLWPRPWAFGGGEDEEGRQGAVGARGWAERRARGRPELAAMAGDGGKQRE